MFEDGLDFGSEDEPAVLLIEVKRLDARAIPCQHELFAISIPKRNRIVAFDVMNKIEPAFFIKMQDGFGVSAGSVNVTAPFQALTQFSVVVNLSVENQPDAIGATTHGLVAGCRQIDNREPAKPKTAA